MTKGNNDILNQNLSRFSSLFKYFSFGFLMLLLIQNVSAQKDSYPNWKHFTRGGVPYTIAEEGNYLWIGTSKALIKFNKSTGEQKFFTSINSSLPNQSVSAVAVDNSGNKWIGTIGTYANGLSKYDGSNWTNYNVSNSDLPDNNIYTIQLSGTGTKWIGTSDGLAKYDGNNWTIFNKSNSKLPDNSVQTIKIDNSGTKWIGTSNGLAKLKNGNWTVYTKSNSGIPGYSVEAVAIDNSGAKWIGTSRDGLAKLENGNWTIYNKSNSGIPSNYLETIVVNASNTKWIGTSDGLAKFDGSNWVVYDPSNSDLTDENINNLFITSKGKMCVGVDAYSIVYYDAQNWKPYDLGLPGGDINHIAVDDSNSKWIGTSWGLTKLTKGKWTVFYKSNSPLPAYEVKSLAIEGSNTKWIGTTNGLARLHNGNWNVYNKSNSGIAGNLVQTLGIDSSKAKWIGTSSGLVRFDNGNWTIYNKSNSGLPSNDVLSIAFDEKNNKWIGTEEGLAKFKNGNWITPASIDDRVSSIAIDKKGYKWIGTNKGLWLLDSATKKFYNKNNSELPLNGVSVITIDKSNNKWIGTGSFGGNYLIRYDGCNWTKYGVTNSPLKGKALLSITIDSLNNKWIGTSSDTEYEHLYKFTKDTCIACRDTLKITDCDSFSLEGKDTTWSTSGTYYDTTESTKDCGNITTINLTIINGVKGDYSHFFCREYTVPSGDETYYKPGKYRDTLLNASPNGCDSIITINLNKVDSTVSKSESTLEANALTATYQWLDCDNGYAEVSGATSQAFTPSSDGNYAVAITKNGCTDTSSCYQVETSTGIAPNSAKAGFEVYPTPAADQLTIVPQDNAQPQTFQLQTLTGQGLKTGKLSGTETVDVDDLSPGVYLLEVKGADAVRTKKVVVE